MLRDESLRLHDLGELLVDCVIFDRKVVLDELLQDFAKRQLVDVAIGIEPSDVHPYLLEDPLPVDHVLKFIDDL